MSAAYLALALAAGWLLLLAVSPAARYPLQSARPYDFLEQIRARRPDLVLVGNSIVHINLDKNALETQLTEKLGRPIRVVFVSDNATGLAWWYLAVKNQVLKSGMKKLAVGVLVGDADLTSLENTPSSRDLWRYGKLVEGDEAEFFAKIGEQHRAKTELYRRMPDRRSIARHLLRRWSNAWLFWLPGPQDGQAVLSGRLQLAEAHPFAIFQSDMNREEKPVGSVCLDLARCVEQTLLPELIEIARPHRLFVVASGKRPGAKDEANDAYRAQLKAYLMKHDVPFLSTRARAELNDVRLWSDANHVNHEGSMILTRLLADEIVKNKLLQF